MHMPSAPQAAKMNAANLIGCVPKVSTYFSGFKSCMSEPSVHVGRERAAVGFATPRERGKESVCSQMAGVAATLM